jgi:hypothetical protein
MNLVITVEDFNLLLTKKREELEKLHEAETDCELRGKYRAAMMVISEIRFSGLDYLNMATMITKISGKAS